ncbi:MAG: hypothetical protein OIN66_14975 [Candidatus Methanoperedens sp.]|nr:hypothetical protein [Candidatus Methanoperedens sp.]
MVLLVPYIIASNAGESGVVISNQRMDRSSLPSDVQDLLIYKNDSYNVILIEDPVTDVSKLKGKTAKERKVVLSKATQDKGSFIRVDDLTTDIYVTSYSIIDQPFEKLIIGDPVSAEFGGVIETINSEMEQLNSYISSDIFNLSEIVAVSKVDFLAGGLLVVLVLTILFHRMVALWNIPAIATLYSFQSFLAIVVSFLNKLEVEGISLMFGFLFILTLPLTLWMKKYEETEEGRQNIYKLYLKHNNILSKIKHKFGM